VPESRGKFELIMNGKTVHKFWDKEVDKGTSMEREVTLTEREFLADAKVKLYNRKSHFQTSSIACNRASVRSATWRSARAAQSRAT